MEVVIVKKMQKVVDALLIDVVGAGIIGWADDRTWHVLTASLSAIASLRRRRGGGVASKCRPSPSGTRVAGRAVHRAGQRRLRLPAGARRRRSRHRRGGRCPRDVIDHVTRRLDPDIVTAGELQAVIMACLYVAFSYVGCEISYPLKVRRSCFSLTQSHTYAWFPSFCGREKRRE